MRKGFGLTPAVVASGKTILLYCVSAGRSALAVRTLQDMGVEKGLSRVQTIAVTEPRGRRAYFIGIPRCPPAANPLTTAVCVRGV
jgi:rhodanese-related sulfurtransferase